MKASRVPPHSYSSFEWASNKPNQVPVEMPEVKEYVCWRRSKSFSWTSMIMSWNSMSLWTVNNSLRLFLLSSSLNDRCIGLDFAEELELTQLSWSFGLICFSKLVDTCKELKKALCLWLNSPWLLVSWIWLGSFWLKAEEE